MVEAAIQQRGREDAIAENKGRVAISSKPETYSKHLDPSCQRIAGFLPSSCLPDFVVHSMVLRSDYPRSHSLPCAEPHLHGQPLQTGPPNAQSGKKSAITCGPANVPGAMRSVLWPGLFSIAQNPWPKVPQARPVYYLEGYANRKLPQNLTSAYNQDSPPASASRPERR